MTSVIIHGRFGEVVGKYHSFACSKLSEVFKAIEANTGKLRSYLSLNRKRKYCIFVDGKIISSEAELTVLNVKNKKITILPVLMGASVGMMLIAGGKAFADLSVGAKIAVVVIDIAVMVGINLAMSKILASDNGSKGASSSSYLFSGAENITQQGLPVPVGYGRFKAGSVVISGAIVNIDKKLAKSNTFYNNLFDSFKNASISESSQQLTNEPSAETPSNQ